jgi:SAM-dependent methyltransferase
MGYAMNGKITRIKNRKMQTGQQIISRQRARDHGEVFTAEREVNAMLDLVHAETERIDSRFLEPACGNGNFLAEILRRKLRIVRGRYRASQTEFDRYAVLAVSSIYGIDILEDNVQNCRRRLREVFNDFYIGTCKAAPIGEIEHSVRFLLERNIVWGDALTLKRVDEPGEYIVFSEWSPVNGSLMKRRDFKFTHLVNANPFAALTMFPELEPKNLFSDLGDEAFIPKPIKEYDLIHYQRIADAGQ